MTMKPDAPRDENTPKPKREPGKSAGPTFAEPEPAMVDLSKDILKQLAHASGERVTCRRITGDLYRCNWWSPQETGKYDNPMMSGLTVTTHRVGRSEVLRVTRTAEGLLIKPVPEPVRE